MLRISRQPVNQVTIYSIALFTLWSLYLTFIYPTISLNNSIPAILLQEVCRIAIFILPAVVILLPSINLKTLGCILPSKKTLGYILIIGFTWLTGGIFIDLFFRGHQFATLTDFKFWIGTFAVASIVEEVIFRGFIFQKLRFVYGFWSAAIISTTLFVVIHFPGWYFFSMQPNLISWLLSSVSIFILGLLLVFIMERTGSVWTCCIIHALNNLAAESTTIYPA